jgi:hypothetical protein
MNLQRTHDYFQIGLRQYIIAYLFGYPGGYSAGYLCRLNCFPSGYFGFWHHGHSLGDGTSLDFCPCHEKTHGISLPGAMTTTRGRLRIRSILTFYHAGLWQRSLYG